MALTLKHSFQSAKTDGADSTLVQPSNWNANHTLTGANNILFGTNGSGAGGEITVSTGLSLSSSTLTVTFGSGGAQSYDADLAAIAALAGTSGFLKKTAADTWTLDTASYLASTTVGTSVQAYDADLAAIAALAGTSGLLKKTAADTWTLDTASYLASSAIGSTVQAWDADLDTWATKTAPSGTVVGTSDTQTLTAKTLTGLRETRTTPSISSGTLTLDCSAGNVFAVSLNANITTLTFTNVPSSGTAFGLTLALTADGTARTITWGSAVKWPAGTAPTLTSTNNKVDVFVLTTWDGGTNWYAVVGGQNL